MRFHCNVCQVRFHDVDQTHRQQLDGLCPTCGHADIEEIPVKICRVMSIGRTEMQACIHDSCNSWNDYFQKCSMEIPAFLNAQEEERMKKGETSRAY